MGRVKFRAKFSDWSFVPGSTMSVDLNILAKITVTIQQSQLLNNQRF